MEQKGTTATRRRSAFVFLCCSIDRSERSEHGYKTPTGLWRDRLASWVGCWSWNSPRERESLIVRSAYVGTSTCRVFSCSLETVIFWIGWWDPHKDAGVARCCKTELMSPSLGNIRSDSNTSFLLFVNSDVFEQQGGYNHTHCECLVTAVPAKKSSSNVGANRPPSGNGSTVAK